MSEHPERLLQVGISELAYLVDGHPDAIVVVDVGQQVTVFANRAAETLLGQPARELIDAPPSFDLTQSQLSLARPDGSVQLVSQRVRDAVWHGRPARMLLLVPEAPDTELQRLTAELAQARASAREAEERLQQAPAAGQPDDALGQAREAERRAAEAEEQARHWSNEAQQANERFRRLYEKFGGDNVDRLEQLEQQVQDYEATLRETVSRSKLEAAVSRAELAEQQVTRLSTELERAAPEAARAQVLATRLEQLQLRLEQLQGEADRASQAAEQVQQLSRQLQAAQQQAARVTPLEEQVGGLQAELGQAREMASQVGPLQQHAGDLEEQVRQLTHEAEQARAAEARLTELTAALEQERSRADGAETRGQELSSQVQALEQKLASLPSDDSFRVRILEQEVARLAETERRVTELTAETQSLREQADQLAEAERLLIQEREQSRATEQRAEELARQVEALRQRAAAADQAEQHSYELSQQLDALQHRIASADQAEQRASESAQQAESLRQRAAAAEQEAQTLRARTAELEQQVARSHEIENVATEISQQAEELRSQLVHLGDVERQAEEATARVASLEQELAQARQRLEEAAAAPQADPELEQRNRQLATQVEGVKRELEAASQQDGWGAAQHSDREDQLEQRVRELEEQLAAASSAQEEPDSGLAHEVDHLRRRLEEAVEDQRQREAELIRLAGAADRAEALERQLEEARTQGPSDDELQKLHTQLDEARARATQFQTQALSAESDSMRLTQERDDLRRRVEDLEHQVSSGSADSDAVEQARKRAQAAEKLAETFEEKLQVFEELSRTAEARAKEAQQRVEELEQALSQAQQSGPQADRETQRLAFEDSLTQLPNLNILQRYLEMASSRVGAGEGSLSLLVIDLDRFRVANETLGQAHGDELLCQVAERFKALVSAPDVVGRRGEDEFLVVTFVETPGGPSRPGEASPAANKASRLAGKVATALQKPFEIAGQALYVSASIGISSYPGDATTPAELLEHADSAMYNAKDAGRGRTQFYTADIRRRQEVRTRLIGELHQAIARQEFLLFFQPIITLGGGRLVGLEALLRWNHPTRGILKPEAFLDVAKDSPLIVTIGDWVVDEACRLIAQFKGKAYVSINIFPRQLLQANFARRFLRSIERARIDAERVVVEISEKTTQLDPDRVDAVLEQLVKWNVGVGIDDFGTATSSITRLLRTKLKFIKISEKWVEKIPHDTTSMGVLRSAIALAQGLGTASLAEGVETPEQLAELKAFSCALGQGYLFCEPVPPESVPDVVRRTWRV